MASESSTLTNPISSARSSMNETENSNSSSSFNPSSRKNSTSSSKSIPTSPFSNDSLPSSPSRRGAIQSVILTHQDVDTYLKKSSLQHAIHSAPTSPPLASSPSMSPSLSPSPSSPFMPSVVQSAPTSRRKSVAINFGSKDLFEAMAESEDPQDLDFLRNQILAKKAEVEGSLQKGKLKLSSGGIFRKKTSLPGESEKDKKKEQKQREKDEKKEKKEKKEKEKKSKKDKKSIVATDLFPTQRRGSTPENAKILPALRGMGQKSSSVTDLHNIKLSVSSFNTAGTSQINSKDEFFESFEDSNIEVEILPKREDRDFSFSPVRTRERSSTTDAVDPDSRARLLGLGFLSPPLERSNSGINRHGKWNPSNRSSSGSEGGNAVPRIPTSFSPKSTRLTQSGEDVRNPVLTGSVGSLPTTPRKLSSEPLSPLSNTTSTRRTMTSSNSSAVPTKHLPHNRRSISEEGKRAVSFDRRPVLVSPLMNLLALRPQTDAIHTKKTKSTGFESEVCEHHSVISKLTDFLLKHATKVEGVFRVSGSQLRVNEIKKNYSRKGELELDEEQDIHSAASFLKMSARNAINPIIPHRLRPFFMKSKDLDEEENFAISYLRGLLVRLPSQNYKLLQKILTLCSQIYENSEATRMTIENLATTIGPSLMPSNKVSGSALGADALSDSSTVVDVFTFMIKHQISLFDKAAKVVFGVASALEDYVPEKSNEIKFAKDDEIVVFAKMSDYYYYGFHYTTKKFGYVVASKINIPQEMRLQEELDNTKNLWKPILSEDSSVSSLSKSPSSSTASPTMSRSESLASPSSPNSELAETPNHE
eukprot:TRINITY_DN3138_c0_g1_i5.p1 TRINITY_DN3138_c0_g1~~TRINITY_DN3138_c0_g1_i5.p1  ORF type:complete len:817 (-),score=263.94 TRINITY_DN3138_c0_g1_i5:186-2636(-)